MSQSFCLRVQRLERLIDQRSKHYDLPDFAAAWAEPDRRAAFLLTVWRVAFINGVGPSALGFPPSEDFGLPAAPSSDDAEEWTAYRDSIWKRLLDALTADQGPGELPRTAQ